MQKALWQNGQIIIEKLISKWGAWISLLFGLSITTVKEYMQNILQLLSKSYCHLHL